MIIILVYVFSVYRSYKYWPSEWKGLKGMECIVVNCVYKSDKHKQVLNNTLC